MWPDNGALGVREGGPSNAVADGETIADLVTRYSYYLN